MPPARCGVGALGLALLLLLAPPAVAKPPADDEGPPAPETPASQGAATTVGSLAPDVYLDDITYTLRASYFRTVAVSPRDPDTAFVGSYNGFLWRTRDGGRTWQETRLIQEPVPFYGDGWEQVYLGVHRSDSPEGEEGGETGAEKPTNPRLRGEKEGGADEGVQGAGGEQRRGASSNVNYGIGVPGAAPRLQLVVRKLGKVTSGINIKQTLYLRGSRPAEIRMIVFHPADPKIVFACTAFGLFKTSDGGSNWVRVFLGISPAGRDMYHLAVDPENPRRILLGTGQGMYISDNGGDSFSLAPDKGVGEGTIRWIFFNPHDSRYVFAGTDDGMLRSNDRGQSWDWMYYTTFPNARIVHGVEIDPFDKKRGYIATRDGVFTTPDLLKGDLESWTRMGGLSFTGVSVWKIAACPRHRGHLWVMTNVFLPNLEDPGSRETGGAFVYETLDGGATWKVIFSGNTNGSMSWFENDPRDPDLLWLVWSRSLGRMRRRSGGASAPFARSKLPDDPPIGDVISAAMRYTGVDPERQVRYRRRAIWKALLPRVSASYRYWHWTDHNLLRDGVYPTLPFRESTSYASPFSELRVMATWDLGNLVFNLESAQFGRVDRINYEIRDDLTVVVHRMYGELRRLRVLMANEPPQDLRTRLMYKLRIEELTVYINFITGNYLERWKQGDRPSGMDTKWWEPWVGTPTSPL